MVTFCLGSARQKRAYFEQAEGVIVLDNVEVLFCASENGRNCFAFGATPFGAFTVVEYLRYRRALNLGSIDDVLAMLGDFDIRRGTLIRKLSPVQMRTVMFLEKTAGRSERPIAINLDGARYSKRENVQLRALLKKCAEAFVCVTDERFVKNADAGCRTLAFGKGQNGKKPSFKSAKKLARTVGARKVVVV